MEYIGNLLHLIECKSVIQGRCTLRAALLLLLPPCWHPGCAARPAGIVARSIRSVQHTVNCATTLACRGAAVTVCAPRRRASLHATSAPAAVEFVVAARSGLQYWVVRAQGQLLLPPPLPLPRPQLKACYAPSTRNLQARCCPFVSHALVNSMCDGLQGGRRGGTALWKASSHNCAKRQESLELGPDTSKHVCDSASSATAARCNQAQKARVQHELWPSRRAMPCAPCPKTPLAFGLRLCPAPWPEYRKRMVSQVPL